MAKLFWVAKTTNPNFKLLKDVGFTVLYPSLDDYVFLETKTENAKWLGREKDLGVQFQRALDGKGWMTVLEEELEAMKETLWGGLQVEGKVRVVGGVYDGMTGVVMVEEPDRCLVKLQGFNREYEVLMMKTFLEVVRD